MKLARLTTTATSHTRRLSVRKRSLAARKPRMKLVDCQEATIAAPKRAMSGIATMAAMACDLR